MITQEEIVAVLQQHYRGFQMDQGEELTLFDTDVAGLADAIYQAIDYRDFIEGGC